MMQMNDLTKPIDLKYNSQSKALEG